MSTEAFVLDHVAVALDAVADAADRVAGELGARPAGAGPGGGFRFFQWEFAGGARLELLEPDGPPGGFVHRFLEQRGAGVHHVTFKVPSLEAAVRRAEAADYDVVGISLADPSWKEAFLHPKQAQGIVVQLAESHPELEPDDPAPEFPDVPAAATASALLGVRLAARSEERARSQWQKLLGGSCERKDDLLVFRWPESPLRIAVGVEPDAEEGARGLEVDPADGVKLAEGPDAVLGTPLLIGSR